MSLLAGCAMLPVSSDQEPSARLPLSAAHIRDERASFARYFGEELARTAPAYAGSRPGDWLHGPGAEESGHPPPPGVSWDAASVAVLVVPGVFGDCLGPYATPFGDGLSHPAEALPTATYRHHAVLGLAEIRLADVSGRASAERNGARLAQQIRALSESSSISRIVLVGYSKGTADALHALVRLVAEDGHAGKVQALVSVAGAVTGTPVADRFAALYDHLPKSLRALDCPPSEGGEIDSLTRHERMAWLSAHRLPAGIAYYSVTAHTELSRMAPGLRGTGRLLARIDPRNDGQMIASDAILPDSTLLAEARTDHWGIALVPHADPRWWVRIAGPASDFPRDALFRAIVRRVLDGRSEREGGR